VFKSEFQGYNPFHGWQPIIWSDAKNIEGLFEPRQITTAAGPLEQMANGDGQALFVLAPKLKAQIISMLELPTDVRCLLNKSEVMEIVSYLRNEVLRWSMELGRVGVVGEGPSFSSQEREKVQRFEFHFHDVQNVSNLLGDIAKGGGITINQQASHGVDPVALTDLAAQLRQNLDSLVPADERPRFTREIEVIAVEAESSKPDIGKLRRALTLAKEMIREGGKAAATSLITQGALALIENALKHLRGYTSRKGSRTLPRLGSHRDRLSVDYLRRYEGPEHSKNACRRMPRLP
jgi:hypothetical protein